MEDEEKKSKFSEEKISDGDQFFDCISDFQATAEKSEIEALGPNFEELSFSEASGPNLQTSSFSEELGPEASFSEKLGPEASFSEASGPNFEEPSSSASDDETKKVETNSSSVETEDPLNIYAIDEEYLREVEANFGDSENELEV